MRFFGLVRLAAVAAAFLLFHAAPAVLLAAFPSTALADCSVGGDGQRPCRIWERIPSCNRGLVEDFRTDRCVKPDKQSYYNVCGGDNKRPCTIVEAFPSCHPGLVEDFGRGLCVKPDKDCGKLDGTPCLFTERLPSCDRGLVEDFVQHKCVPSALAQASCRALVGAITSGTLPPGLKEFANYAVERARGRDRGEARNVAQAASRAVGPAIQPVIDDLKPFINHVMHPDNRRSVQDLFSADLLCGDVTALVERVRRMSASANPSAPSRPAAAGAAAASAKSGLLGSMPFDPANPASICTFDMQLPTYRDAARKAGITRSKGACFVAISFGFSGAIGGGGAIGYTLVLGPKGDSSDTTVFFYLGFAEATNATVGVGPTVTIYPSMRPADFPGWFVEDGLTIGPDFVSAGPRVSFNAPSPFSARGATTDFVCTPAGAVILGAGGAVRSTGRNAGQVLEKVCGTNVKQLQFAGVGVAASIGGSVIPADVGTSITYSWPLYVDWSK